MFWVAYFRAGHWHRRLFYVKSHAITYLESFGLNVPVQFNIPGY